MDRKGSLTLTLKVEGIMCTGCVEDMQTVLRNTDGILDASVSYADGMINIRYDPQAIDEKKVFFMVRKLGFKTTILRGV